MIILTTIKDILIEAGKRILKVRVYGKKDIRTANECAPWGIDSQPVSGTPAVYVGTTAAGVTLVVGYINKKQMAAAGEYRTYSTDENGNVVGYTWLKNNGTLLLNGDDDNAVRYSELEEAFNKLKDDHNDLVSKFNAHVHVLSLTAGTGTAAPPANTGTPSTADITPAKINNIKVPKTNS